MKEYPLDVFFELFQQHSRKLATLVNLLLVVLLSLFVANFVLFFIENMDGSSASVHTITTPETDARPTASVDLTDLDLFGRQQASEVAEVVEAPETKLNLELQGVFTADNEKNSTAIIAEKNKTGELFHIGDKVPGNAILASVYDDHILIRRGTRMEKLMFSDSSSRVSGRSTNKPPASTRPTTSRLQRVNERLAQRRANRDNRAGNPAAAPGSSLRRYVDANRDIISQNPQEVLSQLGVSPVAEGEAKGYKLGGSVSQTSLMKAGLQQGDVILSVNGSPVGNVMNDSAMIDKAMSGKRVRVEVQRGSRRFFLTVPVP
jgi:general secretion pathway protein C